ncbi:MAG: methyltransferase domain-containing protein [Candidatus Marinimicrobia bacterium]|jgi:SAM-dependent methyltransferase|nr:methyltransferase domain-containing protein [Candidatus Neomarinimicrobiota bacterium]
MILIENSSYHMRDTCRLCDSSDLYKVVDYEDSVPVDNYRSRFHQYVSLERMPMSLYQCGACGHVQMRTVVDPNILYGEYIYNSQSSTDLSSHFDGLVDYLIKTIGTPENNFVVDVGCNDGLFLSKMSVKGYDVIGVDPSESATNLAKERNVKVIVGFMGDDVAIRLLSKYRKATAVTASNVFSHADDLSEFIGGIYNILIEDGVFIFEVSYLVDLLFSGVLDYVYHEHLAHHSIKSLNAFLGKHGFQLERIDRLKVKGGSIRCLARKKSSNICVSDVVHEYIYMEKMMGLYEKHTYDRLGKFKRNLKDVVNKVVSSVSEKGIVVGYGASATATVLSQELGYAEKLSFIIDDNIKRQKTLSPGQLVPVGSMKDVKGYNVELIIISAWRFKRNILKNCADYLDKGGRVFIPLPYPSLITKKEIRVLE